MDHVAIMKKSWRLTEKILTGEKTIESRWYAARCAPWDRITPGETVYFKDSGEPVALKARVAKVLQLELTPRKVKEILDEYGGSDGICIKDIDEFYERFKNKKYCMLIFLKDAREVAPFDVDKTGFGNMCAWMCVEDIEKVKRRFQ
jgi:ASC-1-like (ASCH) protein